MKRVLAVALLLMAFASVAFADGGGLPPKSSTTTKPAVVLLADGGGLPPVKSTNLPMGNVAA